MGPYLVATLHYIPVAEGANILSLPDGYNLPRPWFKRLRLRSESVDQYDGARYGMRQNREPAQKIKRKMTQPEESWPERHLKQLRHSDAIAAHCTNVMMTTGMRASIPYPINALKNRFSQIAELLLDTAITRQITTKNGLSSSISFGGRRSAPRHN